MFYMTDDPVADADRYAAEQQKQLNNLPVCEYCGERIQSEFCYEINGDIICDDCMDEHFRKNTDDLIV